MWNHLDGNFTCIQCLKYTATGDQQNSISNNMNWLLLVDNDNIIFSDIIDGKVASYHIFLQF